jgi:hypothetical protein
VSATLLDKGDKPKPLKRLPVSFNITGLEATEPETNVTNAKGTVSIELDSSEPGELRVTARFAGTDDLTAATTSLTIWVVDYREAVSDIYNRFVNQVKAAGIELDSQATPREVERNVVTTIPGINEKLLDELVSVFEEADYSLHDIVRADFMKARRSSEGLGALAPETPETPDGSDTPESNEEQTPEDDGNSITNPDPAKAVDVE